MILAWDCQQSLCSKDLFASPVLGMCCINSLWWKEKLEGWGGIKSVPAQLGLRVSLHHPRRAWSSNCSKNQRSGGERTGRAALPHPFFCTVLLRQALSLLSHSCSECPQVCTLILEPLEGVDDERETPGTAEAFAVSLNRSESITALSRWGRRGSKLPLPPRDLWIHFRPRSLSCSIPTGALPSSAGKPAALEHKREGLAL